MPYIPIVIHSTLHRNQQRFREIPRSQKFFNLYFCGRRAWASIRISGRVFLPGRFLARSIEVLARSRPGPGRISVNRAESIGGSLSRKLASFVVMDLLLSSRRAPPKCFSSVDGGRVQPGRLHCREKLTESENPVLGHQRVDDLRFLV